MFFDTNALHIYKITFSHINAKGSFNNLQFQFFYPRGTVGPIYTLMGNLRMSRVHYTNIRNIDILGVNVKNNASDDMLCTITYLESYA